jgi:hypothetical protein
MTTFSDLRLRILRMLNDPDGEGNTDALIMDAINAAFDAILPWTPKTATSQITGDGSAVEFALPADCYEVEALVVNDTGEHLPRAILAPGQTRGTYTPNTNDFLEYPSGSITLSKNLDTDEIYDLFYLAHWTKIANSDGWDSIIEVPSRAETGIVLYASAYLLLPQGVSAAEIRQFNTRVDSGTPEQNPMQKTALWMIELFQREMNRHPKHQKAVR